MKYSELLNFNPIESLVELTSANDKDKAIELVKTYVMSDEMAEKLEHNMFSQLRLDEVVDNKGVLLVGNYGTGKSHLMSLISAVALNEDYLQYVQNKKFSTMAKCIAGKFEVLRIEIGSVQMPLRDIIFNRVKQDFKERGLEFNFPDIKEVITNKDTIKKMMEIFETKYPDKGYLIVVDEFLDYLGGRKEQEVKLDLGFMRELGEIIKTSRLRVIFGVQEKLFDNPSFSFVSNTLNKIKDRYEQVIIQKTDTAYVVAERLLKKNTEQKALIREHLQKFCSLYSNMSERMDEFVNLYPIHPSYIEVFNGIYIAENRHILKNISEIIKRNIDKDVTDASTGIISFDSYWAFIKENFAYRTYASVKEVIDKSGMLEDIVNRSFPKQVYKPMALQIINALSVHRLTSGDISIRAGLTAENLRDDLCLYIPNMPEQDSEFLQSVVQTVLKDIMTTVSGQFIEHNAENGQYFLDVKKDIDYDEKISQKAAVLDEDSLNKYFFNVVYYCMEWDQKEYSSQFQIYEHTLNWNSRNIFRSGYLFMGTPEGRPTAQPPEDYYIYFLPPYGALEYTDERKKDEVFFIFKPNDAFKNDLKLYAAALSMKELADEKNKETYQNKANNYRKKLTKFLSENKNTCFETIYRGNKKQIIEVLKVTNKKDLPFKDTMDLVASICFDEYFGEKYSDMPYFKLTITQKNQADIVRAGIDYYAGRRTQQSKALLESFDLLDGDKISTVGSKYANYYIKEINKLSAQEVINRSDIFEETYDDYLDKKFKLSYSIMPIILLSLVYTGNAVLTTKDNTTLTASNLDLLPKTMATNISEFKYISKPKEMQLGELIKLFEIMDIPTGLIKNPNEIEKGLEQLLIKAQEAATMAVKMKSKLDEGMELWGEKLIADHIAANYSSSLRNIIDIFGNFASKYNTVAKLKNFNLSLTDLEKLDKDFKVISIVEEYDKFKNAMFLDIQYIMNIEPMDLGASIKANIEYAKVRFRDIRANIINTLNGEEAAREVNKYITDVKTEYINMYYDEHQKKRLNVNDGRRKGNIQSSDAFSNLKKLRTIDILSASKLDDIEKELTSLRICIELTPDMLKTNHTCKHCNFMLGSYDMPVAGRLNAIEDKIDNLLTEWTTLLLNTLSDPLVLEQEQYLSKEQQKVIRNFLDSKQLPSKIDNFFVEIIEALLEGFEPLIITSKDIIDKMVALGPCEYETFNLKLKDIISEFSKGKNKERLRIVIKN